MSVLDGDDRSKPIGILLFGESFLKAARHLQKSTEDHSLKLRFDAPVYNLYAHAIELMLKAYLRTKGVTIEDLETIYGEDLEKLYTECTYYGLIVPKKTHKRTKFIAEWLEEMRKTRDLRACLTETRRRLLVILEGRSACGRPKIARSTRMTGGGIRAT